MLRAWGALRTAAAALLWIPWSDVVSFHASPTGVLSFGAIINLERRLFRKPLVVRIFGGSFDADFELLPASGRFLMRRGLQGAHLLLQTRRLVAYCSRQLPGVACEWFSNSRPLHSWQRDEPLRRARRFVFLGHVKPDKGVRELLEAARRVEAEGCVVDFYGPLMEGLTRADFRGHRNVRYLGEVSPERVVETLREYDVVVLPTYHPGEGYPGVLLEAYSAERPVITTSWRSIPELLEGEECGILVPPRDPEALARAMLGLARDPDRWATLREGARRQARQFASSHWGDRFVEICRARTSVPKPVD